MSNEKLFEVYTLRYKFLYSVYPEYEIEIEQDVHLCAQTYINEYFEWEN